MTPEQAIGRVRSLERYRPGALQLARMLSLAARLEPRLIRGIRLKLAPQLKAGDEADVWFSSLVQSYSPAGIVFYPEVAQQLRTELPVSLRDPVWRLTQHLHTGEPRAIRIEEELTYLAYDPQGNHVRINELLDSLVGSLMSGRSELANWAGRALPRLPHALQTFESLSVLGVASDLRLRRAGNIQRSLSALGHIPRWISRVLPSNAGRVRLAVTLTSNSLFIGPMVSAEDFTRVQTLEVPDTPLIPLEIRMFLPSGQQSSMLFLQPHQSMETEWLDSTRVELITLANQKWTVNRIRAAKRGSRAPLAIRAFTDGVAVTVHWSMGDMIPDCAGFRLLRKRQAEGSATDEPEELLDTRTLTDLNLPSAAKLGVQLPLQRCSWIDRPTPRGASFSYRVVPLLGRPGSLEPLEALEPLASRWTPLVRVGPQNAASVVVAFNRTIDSLENMGLTAETAGLRAGGRPYILDPADPLRLGLGGDLLASLLTLLTDALKAESSVYVAMYEMSDPQLIDMLTAFGARANVLLPYGPQNTQAIDLLLRSKVVLRSRRPAGKGLAHNKFVVIADASGRATTVWTGNVTWSATGLCARSNAAVTITDENAARFYLSQWRLLSSNPKPNMLAISNNATAPKWPDTDMTDTTDRIRSVVTPVLDRVDLTYVSRLIENAREGVLFLLSEPGTKSRVVRAIDAQVGLFKLGAVRNGPALTLYKGDEVVRVTPRAQSFPALSLSGGVGSPKINFGTSLQSRLILIDPLGSRPILLIGSHSFSEAGSRVNDENFVILERFQEVSRRCASHIEGFCEHFRAATAEKQSRRARMTRPDLSDRWQRTWLSTHKLETDFWMSDVRRVLAKDFTMPIVELNRTAAPEKAKASTGKTPQRKQGKAKRGGKSRPRAESATAKRSLRTKTGAGPKSVNRVSATLKPPQQKKAVKKKAAKKK